METCQAYGGTVRVMRKALAVLMGKALACIESAVVKEKIHNQHDKKNT